MRDRVPPLPRSPSVGLSRSAAKSEKPRNQLRLWRREWVLHRELYGISARRQIRIASGKVDVANGILESEWVGVNCEIDREVCRRKQGERTALNKGHSSYYVQGTSLNIEIW